MHHMFQLFLVDSLVMPRLVTPDSWSHDMDKKFHPQLRDNLRAQLKELGFDFR